MGIVGAGLLIAGCQGQGDLLINSTTVLRSTVIQPRAAAPAEIRVPAVAGRNGQIVRDQLRALGLKRVTFASQDPHAKVPIMLGNWTAVKIEPQPGTVVTPTDTVVVTLTKHG
ncbi:PASTA domain-containing protein [Gandjariella thermophila]|uniref:PASTA domain-containing protein n=1 Tax=Gandjariella thermophila TaxID=1931992 RepID=UPI0010FA17BB|nr:hypothetical protein [Gandjariella thermophila]